VSKRTDAPYRRWASRTRLKSKNPASAAVRREREEEWREPWRARCGWCHGWSPALRAVGRAHRYRAATRHLALPGSNAPVGSSRITRCRHEGRGPMSRQKAANEHQRSHVGSRVRIATTR
jgi:hypothetical protein